MEQESSLLVNCPSCGAEIEWSKQYEHRPFCSLRCKQHDFIDWANENRSIPGSGVYDDVFSEDREQ